ncbi:MAG: thiamine pyrophosphate-dependent enzyme [Bacteroidetes bacterium]|nr:thiamine pyrophosphate-dependent enzyme [Bacteroidota bacterium]MCX7906739.1 thiamine pyrophosphate-dependent enzyme [Bacteroidota bacterium]MDW8136981.1 transketolase C-terminal domain-containing protein [Bacteroidota bacterium]
MKAEQAGLAATAWSQGIRWEEVARLFLLSRALDRIEEQELVPQRLVTYQFSARGHELVQILLGLALRHPHDGAAVYYRSRPFMLSVGLTPVEALRATMGRSQSPSEGRDIGVVFNMPPRLGVTVLPMSGDVGAQFTPAVGWAQAIRYRTEVLGHADWNGAIAAALAGDAACATGGFWAALTIATTLRLPMLFFIEDNGYGISVPAALQIPGGNIAQALRAFPQLKVFDADGTDPQEAAQTIQEAVGLLREGEGPVLARFSVPRLCGHSVTDNQAYKSPEERAQEEARDPLRRLRQWMARTAGWDEAHWAEEEEAAERRVRQALAEALRTPEPDPQTVTRFVYHEPAHPQQVGGLLPEGWRPEPTEPEPRPSDRTRINMGEAIRRTLRSELSRNPRMLVFGEDVGLKGGVHGVTLDLQREFGPARVFDTSLNEEGIIGRALGMALAGLLPVPEIQFRKYADPATEQLNDIGTIRWRTAGRFAAPMVVRIPVGHGRRTGDPWHSVSGEAVFAHTPGWVILYPSDAEEAVGLLRSALRGNDPVLFLEHRALLDAPEARRPYPGDDYGIPIGRARRVRSGSALTVVSWGEALHRVLAAIEGLEEQAIEVLDLRTVHPWDRETVFASVRKTGRLLVVHEDTRTCGIGAEMLAAVCEELFEYLDAPVARLAVPDVPVPYNRGLMEAVLPSVERIRQNIERLLRY